MVELLLDDYVLRIWVVCIVDFIIVLSGEIYFTSSLVPLVLTVASSVVAVIAVKVSLGLSKEFCWNCSDIQSFWKWPISLHLQHLTLMLLPGHVVGCFSSSFCRSNFSMV